MWKRIWTLFSARNKEFYRDKSALGWNFLFPFLIIIGFSFIFSEDSQTFYKVGVIQSDNQLVTSVNDEHLNTFLQTKYIEFVPFDSDEKALNILQHHKIDLVINPAEKQYWISDSSPKGYIAEKLLWSGKIESKVEYIKQNIDGWEVPYIEWLFPGILGMNMMFSSLFGVGYVVVRYRKNGVLKRLSVTPTRPFEFLTAQVVSRMFLLLVTTAIVFVGCKTIYGFENRGSYVSLIFICSLGGFSMVALGLLIASRSSSEEFAGGILNLISWPMMFLSEVWFSLEGSEPWVRKLSSFFPLTHLVDCARRIMNNGAGLFDLTYQISALAVMSVLFLTLGSLLFKWQRI